MAVLLMLTPAGLPIFRSYVTGLIWLQSWGPLYAVLHRISMGEAAERMQAAAIMPGGDIGISLVAQAGIRAVASDVAVMSGYLSMSVPFLAAALAYGLSKATVLATSVLAVGQDAASSAAHEGTTGNLSLANTGYNTHRFATLEGRQIRTSAHVDTDRYTGYAPAGAAMTVTGDGTVVADAGAATSRIPAAGVRLSESLASSHETRAAEARSVSRHWSAEAGQARNAAVTDATGLIERYSHDVSTGEAFTRGVTESERAKVQALESHMEKLAEIGGITKNQAAVLTGEAKIGGGLEKIVQLGASGSATWRGETIESDAWNRMKEYDRQHGVTESWGRVAEASRRYSTQTSDSEMAGLDEILDELPTLHQVPSLQPGLAESRQFGGCFVLGVQVASALRDLYGRNGAETISGLCGTRVVLAAPDRDTAQWSADSLGRSEIEEVSEGFSYGANTIRDGVSLTPRRELRALALPSEIMRLPNLEGYLKFPGPFPVASIRLQYVARPKAAERFVARTEDEPEPLGGPNGADTAASATAAEPGGDGGIAIPALPGEAEAEPPPETDGTEDSTPLGDGPEPVPLPGEAADAPEGAGDPGNGEAEAEDRRPKEDRASGEGPGVVI